MAMLKCLLAAASVFISLLVHGVAGDNMTTWFTGATASFYGDMRGRGTNHGTCGYGDLKKQGYGLKTTALSAALFNDGLACGGCYALMCVDDPKGCLPNAGAVLVTATNFCLSNYSKPPEGTNNWCNPPSKHFRLSLPMYTKIADRKTPMVPVMYRRVPCAKAGGVKFQLVKGDSSMMCVLLYNVAGAGDVSDVNIKGSDSSGWLQMTRIQGQTWQIANELQGRSLSFLVTTSDGKMVEFDNIVSNNWRFGETYDGIKNF
ncbi:expansin-A23-like [Argentina anserina]|uniref:expansin-A23-like n=1 Tax=Argentina anserina TaxID=57926 RepID=UPI00217690F5|nr:expansin-A23-like [Potentilla anserina]